MGYPLEQFLEPVDPSLLCHICHKVLQEVVECGECQAEFCRKCITEELDKRKACVACEAELSVKTLRQPRVVRNFLAKLEIKCLYHNLGCHKILGLNSYENHLVNCEYNPTKPVACEGCGVWVPKMEMDEHRCLFDLRTNNEALKKEVEELKKQAQVNDAQLSEVLEKLKEVTVEAQHEKDYWNNQFRRQALELEELHQKVKINEALIALPFQQREPKIKMPKVLEEIKKSFQIPSRVERAILAVDRRNYSSTSEKPYDDEQVAVSPGRYLSSITWTAKMVTMLEPWIRKGGNILVMRAAPGYEVAILAELVGETGKVCGTENMTERVDMTRRNLQNFDSGRVKIISHDHSRGCSEHGPYDVIINKYKEGMIVDKELFLDQLREGGVMLYGNPATSGWSAFLKREDGTAEELDWRLE